LILEHNQCLCLVGWLDFSSHTESTLPQYQKEMPKTPPTTGGRKRNPQGLLDGYFEIPSWVFFWFPFFGGGFLFDTCLGIS
jgi:hypothetical protein